MCKGTESHCLMLGIAVLMHPPRSKGTLDEVLPLVLEHLQTSAVDSFMISPQPVEEL